MSKCVHPWNIRLQGLWPHKSLITKWVLNMKVFLRDGASLEETEHWECDLRRLFLALPLASSSFLFIGCLPQPGCTGVLILWGKRNLYVFWAHRFGPSDEVPVHTLSVQTFIAFVWVRQLSLRSSLWIWLEAPQCFWAYYWLLPVHMDDFTDSRQLNVHRGHI